jgi:hypothetical protein
MIKPEHYKAIAETAAQSGKTPREVLAILAASWNLDPFDRALLEHELDNAKPHPTHDAKKAAEVATERADKAAASADAQAIRAARQYRELRSANPFEAAQFRLRNIVEIERGQDLEAIATTPEPPEAA